MDFSTRSGSTSICKATRLCGSFSICVFMDVFLVFPSRAPNGGLYAGGAHSLVREAGLEPACLAALDPKSSVSASSTTLARRQRGSPSPGPDAAAAHPPPWPENRKRKGLHALTGLPVRTWPFQPHPPYW